ncbi:histone-lysine N-methyltransferase SETDB1-B-like [Simochromis diagramma]|uniref:histone-lysine N-methyltransferase SETDB1-B-like n=1 Tax=Simochromis diagramma TaxID=43689 RepID=UPI001A7E7AC2|nr:histone-lysine N-methyltransferase SETDB1-B-like [Simochromis diagramma]
MSESACEPIHSTNETSSQMTQWENGSASLNLIKKAVVVLTRLPDYKISALRPPTPQQFYSEAEFSSSSGSDMQWQPEDDSTDSDFSVSNNNQKSDKNSSGDTRKPSNSSEINPSVGISPTSAHCSHETTNIHPNLPQDEVKVDMMVLARKKRMKWQRGKIVEIISKEDGRLKYKVSFEEKGKILVSGHHIAFDTPPKVEHLFVGTRVVVQCQDNKFRFQPGVLAELPSRKNRFRFLVFMDDHTPVYVGLPFFHLVCRPLENMFDDIPDGLHKHFMKQYMKDWPYPHLTIYRVGQSLNAEYFGEQQRCEVQAIDCSLIQVVFQADHHREWIYRGSIRLEHAQARFLELSVRREPMNESDSD